MNSVNCLKDKRFAAGIVPGYAQPFVFLVIFAGKAYTLLNIINLLWKIKQIYKNNRYKKW